MKHSYLEIENEKIIMIHKNHTVNTDRIFFFSVKSCFFHLFLLSFLGKEKDPLFKA